MHAVSVALTGLDLREVGVPDVGVDLGQLDPRLGACIVEEAELDALRRFAEDREVRAVAIERCAERVGAAGPGMNCAFRSVHGHTLGRTCFVNTSIAVQSAVATRILGASSGEAVVVVQYVALLRGINVGRSSRIAMADLRALFAELGYADVRTVLQSGTVIFSSKSVPSVAELQTAIVDRFSYSSKVIVVSADRFRAILDANPLLPVADDPSKMVISFTEGIDVDAPRPTDSELAPERLVFGDGALYQWFPDGVLGSRLPPQFSTALGGTVTGRNLRTAEKIRAALDA